MSVEFLKKVSEDGDDPEDYGKILYETGWSVDYKYQHLTVIIDISPEQAEKYTEEHDITCTPGTYAIHASRSGSPFTDYEYDDPEIEEVETYWENVPVFKWKSKASD